MKATNKGKRYYSKSGRKQSAKPTPEKPRTSAKGKVTKAKGMIYKKDHLQPFVTSSW